MDYKKISFTKILDMIIKLIVYLAYQGTRFFLIFYCFFCFVVPVTIDIFVLRYRDDKALHEIKIIIFVILILFITKLPRYKIK
ncbi:hypothetical protein [Sebaldella sp. S0638]|uniref:hypothetical protein n=1 Tax=Sebaldella sp. S0638 TaxID=2957809 RepID=UPI00209E5852|nr:hypothetical protein [Sebaldella sp. S0638]MCP1226249.1 hypothetical protein [Sebaldella sp. S0638]